MAKAPVLAGLVMLACGACGSTDQPAVAPLPPTGGDETHDTGAGDVDDEPRGELVESLNLGFEDGESGWYLRDAHVDVEVARYGERSVRLALAGDDGLGLVSGRIPVEGLRGRRVTLTGWLETADVEDGYAGLWMRVDRGNETIAIDNMGDRGVTGTTAWTKVSVTLDVAEDATRVVFGVILTGKGTAWGDGLDLAISDGGAPVTVAGTVRDAGGAPVAGAVVAIVGKYAAEPAAVVTSDDDGRFAFELRAGSYGITATAPGAGAGFRAPRELDGSATVDLALPPAPDGAPLAGRIVDVEGSPVAGARVTCIRYSDQLGDVFVTEAGDDGRYEVALRPATHSCRAHRGEARSEPVEIAPGATAQDFEVWSAGPAPQAVVDWVRDNAVPVETVRAENGFADMKPLRRALRGARIVALGEATHGTREFFLMKHRVLEFLVAEMGFTVFAIEANWPETEAVNDYVLHGKGDARTALAGLYFWTWNTEEVLELIEWMRRWNANPRHRRKVRFYGFDMQFPHVASAKLAAYLDKVAPDFAAEIAPKLGVFGSSREDDPAARIQADTEAVEALLQRIGKRLDERRAAFEKREGKRAWLLARQALRILEQNVALKVDPSGGIAVRDRSMAENLLWIANVAEPGAKVVAWAHNGHVAHAPTPIQWMGHHVQQAIGEDYVAVGFAFHRGAFQAMSRAGVETTLGEHTVGAAPAGSIGDTFQRTGIPLFALDLRRLPDDGVVARWFGRPQPMRSIGAVFVSEDDMIEEENLPARYDAMIFVEETTRARPNGVAEPEDGE